MKAELKRLQECAKDGAAKKEQVENLISITHSAKCQNSLPIIFFPFSAIGSDQNTAGEGCPRGEGKYCWHWNFKSRPSSFRQNWDLHKTFTNFGILIQVMFCDLHQKFVNIGAKFTQTELRFTTTIYQFWNLKSRPSFEICTTNLQRLEYQNVGKIHSWAHIIQMCRSMVYQFWNVKPRLCFRGFTPNLQTLKF